MSHHAPTLADEHVLNTVDVELEVPGRDVQPGTLEITNFRFRFKTRNGDYLVSVPLAMIERLEKRGGKSQAISAVDIYCRDFRSYRLRYSSSRKKSYDMLSELAFPLSTGAEVFAFKYRGAAANPLTRSANEPTPGWRLFSMRKDFDRMIGAVGSPGTDRWRLSNINSDYKLCPTYPSELILPHATTDADIRKIAEFRSKGRLPVIIWYDKRSGATISRCSQPRVGFVGNRCAEDERYLDTLRGLTDGADTLWIMDARPRRNARANQLKGMGFESTAHYQNCIMTFLNIQNIHVMRDSLKKMLELCWPIPDDKRWFERLDATGWLKHLKTVISGAVAIVEKIEQRQPVLIHCSDGWDRTAQLSSLSLLMLDPYYRTLEGFMVLIEKEWLAFGHKFNDRLGLASRNHTDDQRSPVFLQFLDCVWQVSQQFPLAFEFSEELLLDLSDSMFTCYFGTFLFNSERERRQAQLPEKTFSVWDQVLQDRVRYTNILYSPTNAVLQVDPSIRVLTVWRAYYLRWLREFEPRENVIDRVRELTRAKEALEAQLAELQASGAAATTSA